MKTINGFKLGLRPASLTSRLLSAVFALMVAAGLLLGYTGVHIIEQFARERFLHRMRFLAHHLAFNAELGLLIDERSLLQRLSDNVLTERGVVRVTVEDQSGTVMADSVDHKETARNSVSDVVTTPAMDEENIIFGPGAELERVMRERIIGKVTVFYTDKDLIALVRSLKLRFALIAAGVCLVGCMLMWLVSRSIMAPLKKLVEATRRVADGELDLEVEEGTVRETTNLARSFNAMVNSIRRSRTALKETYEELTKERNMAEVGRFSMILTHEFKNPLGIIKGSLDILRKPGLPSATGELMIRYIEEEVRRIDGLIEEFLSFTRPQKPVFKEFSGDAFLEQLIEKFRLSLGPSGPSISFTPADADVVCSLDEILITRALENILKNAAEVSPPDGSILIVSLREASFWKIAISDEGPGIPPSAEELIFEPFYTTKAKGTGLGLAVASNAVKAHGGRIRATQNSATGATFEICLPLSAQPQPTGEVHGTHSGS